MSRRTAGLSPYIVGAAPSSNLPTLPRLRFVFELHTDYARSLHFRPPRGRTVFVTPGLPSILNIEKRTKMSKSPSKTLSLPAVEGEVVVWGDNTRQQITEAPKSDEAFWRVAPGGATQCLALRMNLTPKLWGNGPVPPPPAVETPGERLGVPLPLQLPPGVQYTDAALGVTHAYFLRSDGKIDTVGKFAIGNKSADVPPALGDVRFVAVTAGGGFGVALDVNGHLHQWGALPLLSPPPSVKFTQIRGRNDYCLALDEDGHIWAWGYSSLLATGALLPGWIMSSRFEPWHPWMHTGKFKAIAAGAMGKTPDYPPHILAIREDGTIAAWGEDRFGQVSAAPKLFAGTTVSGKRMRFQAVAAGQGYSLALDDNGNIYHWGRKGAAPPNGLANVPKGPFASIGAGTLQATAVRPNRAAPLFASGG